MKPTELTVADLMSTNVITINASDPIKEGRADMDLGVIRHLPVVDDRGRLVGVVSDRDLIAPKRAHKIADVMTRDVMTARPETPAFEAASMMLDHKIGSVLVVNDENKLVGVVTQTDYLEVARRALLGLSLER
ncbi:MAG TPA: CBS domain-containing protein [Kofleriaceae bacterium]|nr:CBS domain-containing protein [Kofleriaceae bacterium]